MATNTFLPTFGTQAWDDPTNWSLGHVPMADEDVSIPGLASAGLTVVISASDPAYTVASVTTGLPVRIGTPTGQLTVAGQLTITGDLALQLSLLAIVGNGIADINSVVGPQNTGSPGTIEDTSTTLNSLEIGSVTNAPILLYGTSATIGNVDSGVLYVTNGSITVSSFDSGLLDLKDNGHITISEINNPTSGMLNIFGPSDTPATVDLRSIPFETPSIKTVYNGSYFNTVYQTVNIYSSTGQEILTFDMATPAAESLTLTEDATGGTILTFSPDSIACYAADTLISVPGGDVPAGTLAIGDRVLTACGADRPIKWIGRRSYAGPFLRDNPRVLPIRFRAGSLGGGLPRRDLRVSPRHAMFIDGVLVPADCLVNGVSILVEDDVTQIDYVHIELDSHDLLLAEGTPSESFVDDHSRGMFHNAHEYAALFPDSCPMPAIYCAPRVEEGGILDPIRRRIDSLAGLARPGMGAPLRGSVDRWDGRALHGWAQNPDQPESPVLLEFLIGDTLMARSLANRFRDDLRRAGLGSGCHGFRAELPPSCDGATVLVRRAIDAAMLGRAYCHPLARRAA